MTRHKKQVLILIIVIAVLAIGAVLALLFYDPAASSSFLGFDTPGKLENGPKPWKGRGK